MSAPRIARSPVRPLATGLPAAMLAIAMSWTIPAAAVSDPAEMLASRLQEQRAEALGSQLRCLVCQNESIEDSDAELARDLRRVLREHVAAGESDQQIMRWMVSRYGSFIRLRPAFTAATALLWAMPALALLFGLVFALLAARRGTADRSPPRPLDAVERARLDALLGAGSDR